MPACRGGYSVSVNTYYIKGKIVVVLLGSSRAKSGGSIKMGDVCEMFVWKMQEE